MMRHLLQLAVLSAVAPFLAIVMPSVGRAMTLTPMSIELTAGGNRSHAQFQVGNDSPAPLPIEIIVERLSYSENGNRQSSAAADELAIFPATALIPPGGTQTFRVQWVGSPDLGRSQSFVVTARQLPVKWKADGHARVQIVTAFGAIVNVAPLAGISDLKLVSSSPTKTAQGKPAVSILVENPSDVHALLSNSIIRVGSQSVNPETIRTMVGIGVVEPRKRRRFLVPLQGPANGTASLEYRAAQKP